MASNAYLTRETKKLFDFPYKMQVGVRLSLQCAHAQLPQISKPKLSHAAVW